MGKSKILENNNVCILDKNCEKLFQSWLVLGLGDFLGLILWFLKYWGDDYLFVGALNGNSLGLFTNRRFSINWSSLSQMLNNYVIILIL